jgi:hypothetical protein
MTVVRCGLCNSIYEAGSGHKCQPVPGMAVPSSSRDAAAPSDKPQSRNAWWRAALLKQWRKIMRDLMRRKRAEEALARAKAI